MQCKAHPRGHGLGHALRVEHAHALPADACSPRAWAAQHTAIEIAIKAGSPPPTDNADTLSVSLFLQGCFHKDVSKILQSAPAFSNSLPADACSPGPGWLITMLTHSLFTSFLYGCFKDAESVSAFVKTSAGVRNSLQPRGAGGSAHCRLDRY